MACEQFLVMNNGKENHLAEAVSPRHLIVDLAWRKRKETHSSVVMQHSAGAIAFSAYTGATNYNRRQNGPLSPKYCEGPALLRQDLIEDGCQDQDTLANKYVLAGWA